MKLMFLVMAAGFLSAAPKANPVDFDRLVDQYFDNFFHHNPTQGTSAGFHQYDAQLEDYSLATIAAQIRSLKGFLAKFEQFPANGLAVDAAADRELVIRNTQSQLLSLENIRMWEKNPDVYSSGITSSAFVIMSRSFASPEERLRSLIARERLMKNVLGQARRNLRNPPHIYTEVALQQLPGLVGFFKKDVPEAFNKVTDRPLLDEFHASNEAVIGALGEYQTFLKNDLLPRSKGDFRIGPENYRKKLSYDEMVDLPLDKLLEVGYQNLRQNQEAFRVTAAKIDPKRPPQEILHDLEKDHPPGGRLLQTFRDVLGGLRQFIVEHKIVTIQSTVPPIVQESPRFARALLTASLHTPQPYEKTDTETFF